MLLRLSNAMELILNQLIYFGFLQAVFILAVYLFSSPKENRIDGYLMVLVAVLLLGLSGRVLNLTEMFGTNRRFIAVSEFANLLFGATVYLFTRSSLLGERFSSRSLIHYVPALVYSTSIALLFIFPSDEAIRARYSDGGLFEHVILFIGFALLFNIGYFIASVRIFLRFRRQLSSELSYVVKSEFFQYFLLAIGACLLFWLVIYVTSMFGFEMIERNTRPYIWVSIASIIMFIAYYTRKKPELFQVHSQMAAKKYAQSKLSSADLSALKVQLDQLMEEKKPYLNRNLMKADLAEMLGVNNPEIARLLNERIGMNFFEYVNYFRIKEFIQLAQTDKAKTLTFFGIAQEAGFNSKTTFNKSFKKIMGTSPSEYFAQQLD